MNYGVLKPMPGFVVLKEVEDENNGKILIKSNEQESRAMGKILAVNDKDYLDGDSLKIGDLVVYNEFEGQELFKHGPIDEDHIIVIKRKDIILKIQQ